MKVDSNLSSAALSLEALKSNFSNLISIYDSFKGVYSKFVSDAASAEVTVQPLNNIDLAYGVNLCDGLINDIDTFINNLNNISNNINKTLGELNINSDGIDSGYTSSSSTTSISLKSGSINEESTIAGYSFVIDGNYFTWYGGDEYKNFDEYIKNIKSKYPDVDVEGNLKVLIKTDDSPIAWIDYKTLFNTKENSTSSSPNNTSTSTTDKSNNTNGNNEQSNVEVKSEDKPSTGSSSVTPNNDNPSTYSNGVIDTSVSNYKASGYSNLTEEEIATLAYIAFKEQGSVEGAKIELSLMCNQYEQNKSKYDSVYDYVQNSGWFAAATDGYTNAPSSEYYEAARDVLVNGNHYLPSDVVEHDWEGNIISVSNDGTQIDKYDRSSYIPGVTEIRNEWGSIYKFVGFAPNGGNPFGYLTGYWK